MAGLERLDLDAVRHQRGGEAFLAAFSLPDRLDGGGGLRRSEAAAHGEYGMNRRLEQFLRDGRLRRAGRGGRHIVDGRGARQEIEARRGGLAGGKQQGKRQHRPAPGRAQSVLGGARHGHSNSMMTASTARLSPLRAWIALTLPSRSARRTFSIFIASTMASGSPALTSWPTSTAIDTISPGIGQSSLRAASDRTRSGIRRASSASRPVYTRATISIPRWLNR